MFNQRVTFLPIFLAFVLIYLILGDCLVLKVGLSAVALFLVYLNYIPATPAVSRSASSVVAPVYGQVSAIEYDEDSVKIEIEKTIYQSAIVTMPISAYVDVKTVDGAVVADEKLSQMVNQKVSYSTKDGFFSMRVIPHYFAADNYIDSDRYYIGDVIGRVFSAKIEIELSGVDVKVGVGDKIEAKSTVLAYKHEQ